MTSEQIVKEFLEGKGLIVNRFSKKEIREKKTPDYKIYHGDSLVFYCEVKESEKDTWLSEKLEKAAADEIVGGSRSDPIFNRLTTHIHKAKKQFESVNPSHETPNILAFYNADEGCGLNDLLGVVSGGFMSENGPIKGVYERYSEGRLKEDLEHIDLVIWLDKYKPFRYLFVKQDHALNQLLSTYFKYDYGSTYWINT